jgi:hypothetical protein
VKFVLYEVTNDYDVVIKLSFENRTYLSAFIEQHTAEKKYEPKFLIFEFDDNEEIEWISEYNGNSQKSRKCVVEYTD